MGGANLGASSTQKTVNEIISSILAKTVSGTSTKFEGGTSVTQSIINSTGCKNIVSIDTSTIWVGDTQTFQKDDLTQTTCASIATELSSQMDQNLSGFGGRSTLTVDNYQEILNTVSSSLTSEVLDINNNSSTTADQVTQLCKDSTGGVNYYYGTRDDITLFYTKSYQTNDAVQNLSATLNNMASFKSSQTKIGIMATVVRMLGFMIIALIIGGLIIAGIAVLALIKFPI